ARLRLCGKDEGQREEKRCQCAHGPTLVSEDLQHRRAPAHGNGNTKTPGRAARASSNRFKVGCPARIRTSTNWSRASRATVTPPGSISLPCNDLCSCCDRLVAPRDAEREARS